MQCLHGFHRTIHDTPGLPAVAAQMAKWLTRSTSDMILVLPNFFAKMDRVTFPVLLALGVQAIHGTNLSVVAALNPQRSIS
ncbi:Hypothetical protein NGAL_HAMBI1146_08090 [Neorhizobium galegae bv. officinalis]|nr:Hypothetical protein NGAL_HAMBI490_46280 [Neorhizobium galegae bv. officinalis]CDZ34338.1 Hypothetical protein NGAL_HAMBI1146_08090 [Neorhizobium galegae bv. officinalis]